MRDDFAVRHLELKLIEKGRYFAHTVWIAYQNYGVGHLFGHEPEMINRAIGIERQLRVGNGFCCHVISFLPLQR